MIFEQLGKFCFFKLRPFYFLLILLTPILFAFAYFLVESSDLSHLEEAFANSCKRGKSALEKKKEKEYFTKRYSQGNPYFLDEKIESLSFLQSEQKELESWLKHPALVEKKLIESRLDFLKNGSNRLSFAEEAIRSSSTMKEVEEKQRRRVEMDETDLKQLLSLMEDLPMDTSSEISTRPQIVITDFQIHEKKTPLKTNVFEVEMQFIKREFIP